MANLETKETGAVVAPRNESRVEKQADTQSEGFAGQAHLSGHTMKDSSQSSLSSTLTLRVTEACVEDVGRAIARLSPGDLQRMGAKAGDVLKITGSATAVGRAELSAEAYDGMIQIDGTGRSNCGAGLQEQVIVTRIDSEQAVAVRLTPLWIGAAPATIAPDRMLEDLEGVPVIVGGVVRVPTFAKAVNFQVVRTIRDWKAHRHQSGRRRSNRGPRSGRIL